MVIIPLQFHVHLWFLFLYVLCEFSAGENIWPFEQTGEDGIRTSLSTPRRNMRLNRTFPLFKLRFFPEAGEDAWEESWSDIRLYPHRYQNAISNRLPSLPSTTWVQSRGFYLTFLRGGLVYSYWSASGQRERSELRKPRVVLPDWFSAYALH